MNLSIKHFAYCIFCVIIFGLILVIFGGIRDSQGNQGIHNIFASKFPEGSTDYAQSAEFISSDKVLSMHKPVITCDAALVEGGIVHGTTVLLSDLIIATEDEKGDGTNLVTLSGDNITVHEITDKDGNALPGFAEGDASVVFPKKGVYTLTVTAEYQKGCSSRSKVNVIVKK